MTGQLTFRATVQLGGKTATGIEVPTDVVAALAAGKRPAVQVTLGPNGYAYTTTVGSMGGRFLIPLSAQHRVSAGDVVEVQIQTYTSGRDVAVPADLAAALAQQPTAQAFFEGLAYSHRKEWVRWLEDAKSPRPAPAASPRPWKPCKPAGAAADTQPAPGKTRRHPRPAA